MDGPVDEAESAWARVAVLLRIGDVEQAALQACYAVAVTRWSNPPLDHGGIRIQGSAYLPVGWVFINPDQHTAVVNAEIRSEFMLSMLLRAIARPTCSGPTFRQFDVQQWRAQEAAEGIEFD